MWGHTEMAPRPTDHKVLFKTICSSLHLYVSLYFSRDDEGGHQEKTGLQSSASLCCHPANFQKSTKPISRSFSKPTLLRGTNITHSDL